MSGERTYLKTHPWINFDLGTSRYGPRIWMLLGEATSKAMHIAGVPLAPEKAEQLYSMFLAKGARATTAIEGNTLTEEQVVAQVEGRLKLPPSQSYLQQEVQNVLDGCNYVVDELDQQVRKPLDTRFVCHLNSLILKDLRLEEGTQAGAIRQHSVVVGNVYRGAPAEDCAYLLALMCEKIEEIFRDATEEDLKHSAIIAALFAHVYLALIHPFGDGNGRTARLLELYILLRAGFPQPTGHLLSNHYNMTRSHYYSELDRVSKSGGDIRGFVEYALRGFVDGLKEQISRIRAEQMHVAWVNYVHDKFAGMKSSTDHRRRELVLQLSEKGPVAKISELMELTPRLAREYADKTDKTLTRDINALQDMGLVRRLPGRRVRARTGLINAFLPWRTENHEAG